MIDEKSIELKDAISILYAKEKATILSDMKLKKTFKNLEDVIEKKTEKVKSITNYFSKEKSGGKITDTTIVQNLHIQKIAFEKYLIFDFKS